jgi:hypothetical protein
MSKMRKFLAVVPLFTILVDSVVGDRHKYLPAHHEHRAKIAAAYKGIADCGEWWSFKSCLATLSALVNWVSVLVPILVSARCLIPTAQ